MLGLGMECDPKLGCRESGSCQPVFTHQECLLRKLTQCGSGVALGVCHVELAEPIENSICVQSDSAAMCDQSNLSLRAAASTSSERVLQSGRWLQLGLSVPRTTQKESGLPLETAFFFCDV